MKAPNPPPDVADLLADRDGAALANLIASASPVDARGRYLHWDDLRMRTPPHGLDHQTWWLATKLARRSLAKRLPITRTDGGPMTFCNVDAIQAAVHSIDQLAGGQLLADDLVTNLRSSDRYLVSSLVEEAITSSQLEGASTSRRDAKALLATGRKPANRSEQMIVNNYRAMLLAQDLADTPFTPAHVLELHRAVTIDALDDPADAGRLQRPGDDRVAVWWHDGSLLHQPPPADALAARLDALCAFANGETPDGFVHPVVRAIIVHFWLAYDHPFADGNGRTARALFYWSMLRGGYWLTQYLSVSSILRTAPSQYARSYLLVESDECDVTYFVLYQLQVIQRAVDSLRDYLTRKITETREIEAIVHRSPDLNHRQLLVVRDALRDPGEPFTIAAQARRNRVTIESARSDLRGLEGLGLLTKGRQGKKFVFHAVPDLEARLRALGAETTGMDKPGRGVAPVLGHAPAGPEGGRPLTDRPGHA